MGVEARCRAAFERPRGLGVAQTSTSQQKLQGFAATQRIEPYRRARLRCLREEELRRFTLPIG